MPTKKRLTGVRLSPEADALIALLRERTGATATGVMEAAVRYYAIKEGISLPSTVNLKEKSNAREE